MNYLKALYGLELCQNINLLNNFTSGGQGELAGGKEAQQRRHELVPTPHVTLNKGNRSGNAIKPSKPLNDHLCRGDACKVLQGLPKRRNL